MWKCFLVAIVACGMVMGAPESVRAPMLDDAQYLLNWAFFEWENPSTAARVIINYAEQGGDSSLLYRVLLDFNIADEEAMFLASSALEQSIVNGSDNTLLFVVEVFEQLLQDAPAYALNLFLSAIHSGEERSQVFAQVLEMLVQRNGCEDVQDLIDDMNLLSREQEKMEIYIYSMLRQAGPANECETCQDFQTGDQTCETRYGYGQCEEEWMKQGYSCAMTCGFCQYIPPEDKPGKRDLEQTIPPRSAISTEVETAIMKVPVEQDELVYGDGKIASASQADQILDLIQQGDVGTPTSSMSVIPAEQKAYTYPEGTQASFRPIEVDSDMVLGQEPAQAESVPTTPVQTEVQLPASEDQEVTNLVQTLSSLLGGQIQNNGITIQPIMDEPDRQVVEEKPVEEVTVEQPEVVGSVQQQITTVLEALMSNEVVLAAEIFAEQLLADVESAKSELASAIDGGYSAPVSEMISIVVSEYSILNQPFSDLLIVILSETGEPASYAIAQGLILAYQKGDRDNAINILVQILNEGGQTTINMVLGIEQELIGGNCEIMLDLMNGVQERAAVQNLSNVQLSLLMLGTRLQDGCSASP